MGVGRQPRSGGWSKRWGWSRSWGRASKLAWPDWDTGYSSWHWPFPGLPCLPPPPGCRRKCPRVGVPGSCHMFCCPHHRSSLYRINACQQQEGQDSPIPDAWQPGPNASSDYEPEYPGGTLRKAGPEGWARMPPRGRGSRLERTLHQGLLAEVPGGKIAGGLPDPTPSSSQPLRTPRPAVPSPGCECYQLGILF